MDELADRDGIMDRPIKPLRCPRCGKKVIFERDDRMYCEDCGELYFDNWLGIWRIKTRDIEED